MGLTTLGFVAMPTWFHAQDGLSARENEDAARWVRVGVNMPSVMTIQRASGEAERVLMSIDTTAYTISCSGRGDSAPETPQFSYEEQEEGVLRLGGSCGGSPTEVVMMIHRIRGLARYPGPV